MSTLSKAISFLFEKRGQADGQSINVKTIEGGEFTRETEFYQLPGISSGITPGSQCVIQEIEGGYSVIVASHNYNLNVSVTGGQTKIYSTDPTGMTKQAEIFLDTNGDIVFSQNGKTIFKENVEIEKNLKVSEEITVGATNIEVSKHGHITVLGTTVGPVIPIQ